MTTSAFSRGAADVFTLYHGAAVYELRDLFEQGELSDVDQLTGPTPSSVFIDAKGHAGQIVLDAGTLLWLAAIHDIEPIDFPEFDNYELDIRAVAQQILDDQRGS